ncbi:MAG: hemerythrin family protein [Candidatus Margulisiibacteriota bacterium]
MKKKTNIPSIDKHHLEVFEMVHLLDEAIKGNSREAFEPIIKFLVKNCIEHFKEEEEIMIKNNFSQLKLHQQEHQRFTNKIKQIQKMYNENIHTTHIAYGIRQLIDSLISHVHKVDIQMKGMK